MKCKTVKYQKCFNLGNYENEVIGVELEVGENEKAEFVLEQAKIFVEAKGKPLSLRQQQINKDQHTVNNPENNSYTAVVNAQKRLDANIEISEDDLPF